MLRRQKQVGILAGACGIDQAFGHRLHRLLVAAREEDAAEECFRLSGVFDQPGFYEFGERVEIARFRNRIGKSDVAPAQVCERADAAVAPHEDAARITRRVAVDLGQERHGTDLGLGQNEGQGAHEGDIRVAVAQRLDRRCMVDGDEPLDGDADLLCQPSGDGLDVPQKLVGVLLRDEGKPQGYVLRGERCRQRHRARADQGQYRSTGQMDRHQNALSSIASASDLNAVQLASAASQSSTRTAAPTAASRSASA